MTLPLSDSVPNGIDVEKLRNAIATKQLVGLANTTKWNELIVGIRSFENWRPSYRHKSINGYISGWDVEWSYHLPFPFISVEWFDISFNTDKDRSETLKEIKSLVGRIGFEYEIQNKILRIWGYGPKCYESLTENT